MESLEQQFQQALKYHSAGDINAAMQAYEALLNKGEHPGALSNLGQIYRQQGDAEKAIQFQLRACASPEAAPEMHFNLGNALRQAGRLDESQQAYQKAIELRPEFALAHMALGLIVQRLSSPARASKHFQRALDIDQSLWRAWQGRAEATLEVGAPEDAVADLQKATQLGPQQLSVWRLLAETLSASKSTAPELQANLIQACQRWAELDKTTIVPLAEIANRCWEAKQHEPAINALREAAKRVPEDPAVLSNLAFRLSEVHHVTEALEFSQKALAVMPDNKDMQALPAKLHLLSGDATTAVEMLGELYAQDADAAYKGRNWLFSCLYDESLVAGLVTQRHQQVTSAWERPANQYQRKAREGRQRRIGFISPDLAGDHPVVQFFEPILSEFHSQAQMVYVYSSTEKTDEIKTRLQGLTNEWHDVQGMEDNQLAALIHEHQVDVLIDLAGHTKGGSLSVFGHRPAPIQMSWLGYPYSTGHPDCDYLLVDEIVCPSQYSDRYTEKLLYLPDSVFPVPKLSDAVAVSRPEGAITFGNFGAFQKVSPNTYALWLNVLKAIPDSRLVLKNGSFADAKIREAFAKRLIADGIGSHRFELLAPSVFNHMLGEYNKVDIVLDTLAYNGGTTAFHALWMGVPTLTLPGEKFCNRMGASVMTALDAAEWVASSPEDYLAKAVMMSLKLDEMRSVRATWRERLLNSKLGNYQHFSRQLLALCHQAEQLIDE